MNPLFMNVEEIRAMKRHMAIVPNCTRGTGSLLRVMAFECSAADLLSNVLWLALEQVPEKRRPTRHITCPKGGYVKTNCSVLNDEDVANFVYYTYPIQIIPPLAPGTSQGCS